MVEIVSVVVFSFMFSVAMFLFSVARSSLLFSACFFRDYFLLMFFSFCFFH